MITPQRSAPPAPAPVSPPLGAVARVALWLGVIGFGGGYAVLAQLRAAVVERHRWMSDDDYADYVSVAQTLPGASGANFFTLLGQRARGLTGAALATTLFILPSALLMVGFGVFYDDLRRLQEVEAIFAGMNPAVVAIIASVAVELARKSSRPWQLVLAFACAGAIELGVGVFEVVLLAVTIGLLRHALRASTVPRTPMLAVLPLFLLLPKMAIVFLRIGASAVNGLAMIPILDHEVVARFGWLTQREFSDAVTLGQVTPGPVAITSTFIGFRVAGVAGALVATVGTFLPPFVMNAVAGRSIQAFRGSPALARVLEVLGPATAGIVLAAALSLGRASLHGWVDGAVCAASFAVLMLRVSPVAVLVGAALVRAAIMLT